jgi:hypothetical protein
MATTDPTLERLRAAFDRIARHAVERERQDEPLEVRELRRLSPSSPVLRYFASSSPRRE